MAVKQEVAKLLVKNRPLGHYVLSVYSLLFRGYCVDNNKDDIITLIAPSRSVSRTTDLANILARICAPGLLWLSAKRTKISNRLQSGNKYPKVSNLIVKLTSFNRGTVPDDEGIRTSQYAEKRKALRSFNVRRKERQETRITEEEYPFVEALAAYREDHPGVSLKEVKDNLKKFKQELQNIQNELLARIVKAIPSKTLLENLAAKELTNSSLSLNDKNNLDNNKFKNLNQENKQKLLEKLAQEKLHLQLYIKKGGKVGVSQEFNICELEFILSSLLKDGCELHFTCPDKRVNIELKFTPEDQDKIQELKWDKDNIIRDKNGNKIIEVKKGETTVVKTGKKINREKLSLDKKLQLVYDGKTICENPQTKFKYTEVQEKGTDGKKKFNVPGEDINLGKVSLERKNIKYTPLCGSRSLPVTVETCRYVKSSIGASLMRMGLLPSPKLEELAKDMCGFDDVLIGLDTTCFYQGITTGTLLDSFVGVARYPYLDTPNWTTLIASVISTGEIEHKANACKDYFDDKDTQGMHNRRTAYRALQEFMEISTCADLEGVSMLLTGEIPPGIDFSGEGKNTIRDELIRKQIKNFLGNLGFHKGTYFLTGDRGCAMFARAEGLNAIYLTREKWDIKDAFSLTNLPSKNRGEEQDIHNISEIVYELGVEFPLKITCEGEDCELSGLSLIVKTDWEGKTLEEWENRNLMVKVEEADELRYSSLVNYLNNNANVVNLGQLLWGWKRVNARHHEVPGFPRWAT